MKDMPTWIDEYHKGSRFGLNGKVLLKKNSKYQEILIIETDFHGKALMLDGCWMTSLRDEKYYHECLVHPALSSIDNKSHILIIGGGDGGTARECLKYSQVAKIDLVEIDEEVIKVSKTFLKEIGGEAWSDKRLAIHIDDGVKWVEKTKDNFYDVIFIDCSDPSEFSNLLFRLYLPIISIIFNYYTNLCLSIDLKMCHICVLNSMKSAFLNECVTLCQTVIALKVWILLHFLIMQLFPLNSCRWFA